MKISLNSVSRRALRAVQVGGTVALLGSCPGIHAQQPLITVTAPDAYSSQVVAQLDRQSTAQLDAGSLAQFDPQIMQLRGLDPSIGNYFRRAPRFTPGDSVVSVTLNGTALGRKSTTFDDVGQLCFTPAFVRALGLAPMTDTAGQPVNGGVQGTCLQYRDFAPQTVVSLQPSAGAVDIVVSPKFVVSEHAVATDQGGTGALLNYRAYALDSRFSGAAASSFRQVDSTVGFNTNDWIFRSQQSYSRNMATTGTIDRWRWQSAYGQKTFAEQRQILQAGRIHTQSPLYGGIAFVGGQWFPESALSTQNVFAVKGLANSRARVEVSQNGALLYSTVVPPGPFSVSDFALNNRAADLKVRVIEEGGVEQNFTVSASQLLLAADNTVAEGLSIAAGSLWDVSDGATLATEPFLSASQGWRYGGDGTGLPNISGVVGGLISKQYVSTGFGLNTRLWDPRQSLYLQALAARDSAHDLQGLQAGAAAAFSPSDGLQFGISGNVRTRGYRSLQEAKSTSFLRDDPGGYNTQLGGNVLWNTGDIGGFTAGLTRQSYFNGQPGYTYSLGWNVSLHDAQLSFGLAHSASRTSVTGSVITPVSSSSYLYANLSIPLGYEVNSTSYVRNSNDTGRSATRMGTGIDQRVNEYFGYRATVEREAGKTDSTDSNFTAYATPKYTSLTMGVGQGSGHSSYYAEASGGIVLHAEGIAFTPTAVQDTFAVVKVGNVAGVRLDTPQGPVWSGINGLAAIPSLSPYHESRIEVSGKSLPDDVDVDNGLQVVQAGRGAVLKLDMGATLVRRVLLMVTTATGTALPAGVAVLRGDEFFTASASGGRVMMTNLQEALTYKAQLAENQRCTFRNIQIRARVDGEVFERGTAVCQ